MATLSEQRVLSMVQAGTITEAEGQRLIDAMQPRPARWRMLLNPFDQLSTQAVWTIALLTTTAGLAISQLGIRFDGTLDLHQAGEAVPWRFALLDSTSAIVVTSLVFWFASLLVAKQGRLVDFMLSVGVARIPVVAVGALLPWILPPPDVLIEQATSGTINIGVILASLVVLIPGFIWLVVLLCTAFKTSSGTKGLRLGVTFTIAVVAAEIASKIFLFLIAPRI